VRTRRSVWQWIDESESKGGVWLPVYRGTSSGDATSAYLVTYTPTRESGSGSLESRCKKAAQSLARIYVSDKQGSRRFF
jgi:hypothetical protein